MPRKASPKETAAKKMLSWRESEDVIQAAIAISEAEDSNKQITFSALFRNGIALHDLQEEVRAYLKSKRMQEVERLEQSKDKWLRKEAKSRRTMLTLYEPTDAEVADFILIAVKEKMYGKIRRPADVENSADRADVPLFGDGIEVSDGILPEADDGTVTVLVGDGMALSEDTISAMFRNDGGHGDAHMVNLIGGTLKHVSHIEKENLLDDGATVKLSIHGDIAYNISITNNGLFCERAFLDARTGEYESFTPTHDYLGTPTPTAINLMWRDGAVRIDGNGARCYKTGEKADVEGDRIMVSFGGYTVIDDDGADDLQVLHD